MKNKMLVGFATVMLSTVLAQAESFCEIKMKLKDTPSAEAVDKFVIVKKDKVNIQGNYKPIVIDGKKFILSKINQPEGSVKISPLGPKDQAFGYGDESDIVLSSDDCKKEKYLKEQIVSNLEDAIQKVDLFAEPSH